MSPIGMNNDLQNIAWIIRLSGMIPPRGLHLSKQDQFLLFDREHLHRYISDNEQHITCFFCFPTRKFNTMSISELQTTCYFLHVFIKLLSQKWEKYPGYYLTFPTQKVSLEQPNRILMHRRQIFNAINIACNDTCLCVCFCLMSISPQLFV